MACAFNLSAPAARQVWLYQQDHPQSFFPVLNSSILEAISMQEIGVIHFIKFYSISLNS
jgi:hypothetical protein